MRYLFFDIESSDGSKAICEFGYLITDTKFNILKKRNILINPNYLYSRIANSSLLHYTPKEYAKHPQFNSFYKQIKDIIQQKDVIVFGYSVYNDIIFLDNSCKRYKLAPFYFNVYDVQKIYAKFLNNNETTSLENAVKIINPEDKKEIKAHRALDDSILTMLLLKKVFSDKNNLKKIFNEKFALVKSELFLKRHEKNKQIKEKWRNEHKGLTYWMKLINRDKNRKQLLATKIDLSAQLKNDIEAIKTVEKFAKAKKYLCTDDYKKAKIIIVRNNEEKNKIIDKHLKTKSNKNFITYQKILDFVNKKQ